MWKYVGEDIQCLEVRCSVSAAWSGKRGGEGERGFMLVCVCFFGGKGTFFKGRGNTTQHANWQRACDERPAS